MTELERIESIDEMKKTVRKIALEVEKRGLDGNRNS